MKRIMLKVAYDGTNYVGWQIQKNGTAVEEVLNRALAKLLNEDVYVIGASRTDSGVHALRNVAVFDTGTKIPAEKIFLAVNQILPPDIKVTESFEVAADFHPRHADCVKTYRYRILNSRFPIPTLRLYTDYVYYPLDADLMRNGAEYLIGEHDFTAFSTAKGQQRSPVRTIYSINIDTSFALPGKESAGLSDFLPQLIDIIVKGNGFLYNMVRIIAGTLEKVGMGVFPPEHVKEILESKDRSKSSPKASACGLTLLNIEYK